MWPDLPLDNSTFSLSKSFIKFVSSFVASVTLVQLCYQLGEFEMLSMTKNLKIQFRIRKWCRKGNWSASPVNITIAKTFFPQKFYFTESRHKYGSGSVEFNDFDISKEWRPKWAAISAFNPFVSAHLCKNIAKIWLRKGRIESHYHPKFLEDGSLPTWSIFFACGGGLISYNSSIFTILVSKSTISSFKLHEKLGTLQWINW